MDFQKFRNSFKKRLRVVKTSKDHIKRNDLFKGLEKKGNRGKRKGFRGYSGNLSFLAPKEKIISTGNLRGESHISSEPMRSTGEGIST